MPFSGRCGEGGQRFGCLKNPIIIQNAISLFPIKKKHFSIESSFLKGTPDSWIYNEHSLFLK